MMLKFQWNALRRGERVFVHDASEPDLALRGGVVTVIDVHPLGHDMGIRLTSGMPTGPTVRPGRFAVHLAAANDDHCWRCSDNHARRPDIGVGRGPEIDRGR